MLDVELLAQVYLELMGGKQPGLELLAKTSVAAALTPMRQPAVSRPAPLTPRLSEAERSRHEALIERLGANAIWKI
jgi:DNA polymerase-3 subunit epsilon